MDACQNSEQAGQWTDVCPKKHYKTKTTTSSQQPSPQPHHNQHSPLQASQFCPTQISNPFSTLLGACAHEEVDTTSKSTIHNCHQCNDHLPSPLEGDSCARAHDCRIDHHHVTPHTITTAPTSHNQHHQRHLHDAPPLTQLAEWVAKAEERGEVKKRKRRGRRRQKGTWELDSG